MRVLIADDEAHARAKLRRMLTAFADIEVVGEAVNGTHAVTLCVRLAPDAMFLDMQMPELDGFGVIGRLALPRPSIVMVTAFEEHALGAFDADVTDYLLKPVGVERLERSVRRLRAVATAPPSTHSAPATLLISDRSKSEIVNLADVEWLESADNYVHVHAAGKSSLVRRTLANLLHDLGPSFVRIHRCFAVPIDQILEVHARGKGDATVVLRSGRKLPCSRQHKTSLMSALNGVRVSRLEMSDGAV